MEHVMGCNRLLSAGVCLFLMVGCSAPATPGPEGGASVKKAPPSACKGANLDVNRLAEDNACPVPPDFAAVPLSGDVALRVEEPKENEVPTQLTLVFANRTTQSQRLVVDPAGFEGARASGAAVLVRIAAESEVRFRLDCGGPCATADKPQRQFALKGVMSVQFDETTVTLTRRSNPVVFSARVVRPSGGVVGGAIPDAEHSGALGGGKPEPKIVPAKVAERLRVHGTNQIKPSTQTLAAIKRNKRDSVAVLKYCVRSAGLVKSVKMMKRSGYPIYDQLLKSKVRRWRFRPMRVDGKMVEFCSVATFTNKGPRRRPPEREI